MPDPGVFDLILKAFDSVFTLAWAGLTPATLWLASYIAVWCLIPYLALATVGVQSALPAVATPLIKIMFVVWVIGNMELLTNSFADWVVTIGLFVGSKMMALVGAKPMTLADFMSPGTVLYQGFNMMLPVMKYVEELSWYDVSTVLAYDFFCVIPLWICFVIVSGNIIVAIVEFKIVALWSLIPMAFALFSGTAFVASSAISGIIASGMRLGALAFVTGIILPVTFYLAIPLNGDEPAIWNILAAGAGAVLLAFMSWHAPRYASSFFGGAPAFTGQALIGMGVGAIAGAARGYQRWVKA